MPFGHGDRALDDAVEKFVGDIHVVLSGVSGELPAPVAARLADDVTVEASNLVLALIDADGRLTDEELWAYLSAFGPRFDTNLSAATPADLRKTSVAAGKHVWLEKPSPLFELLVGSDAKHQTAHSWTYYDRAVHLAFATCSLDTRPSDDELRALEGWRSLLVSTMERSGVAKPGSTAALNRTNTNTNTNTSTSTNTGASTSTAAAIAPAPAPALGPPEPLEALIAELDALVGLAGVKTEVKLVTNLLRVQKLREARGLPVVESSHHLVFTGNPGTGKTTVARLLARIYRTLTVVAKGHLVETDRAGLVAGFVGQTALKVTEVFDRADGGVLLIDEAYALARGGERDFGREAIDTVVKLIEDRRDRVVVIAAGYPTEMAEFIDANPGLRSRFPKTIDFPDYTDDELLQIFASLCKKSRYEPTPEAVAKLRLFFAAQPRSKGFGNGRLARNCFESAIARQATRLVGQLSPDTSNPDTSNLDTSNPDKPGPEKPKPDPTDQQLLALEADDIPDPAPLPDPRAPATGR